MVHATCAALHCLSSSNRNKDLKFHQFPHDEERRNMWIKACKRTDVIDKDWEFFKHKHVCGIHFQKCMYTKNQHLKKSAIPSLHLAEKPMQHDSYTQTWDTIQFMRPYVEIQNGKAVGQTSQSQTDFSIVYVMQNPEKIFQTSQTQTEDILYAKYNLKKEKEEGDLTHAQIEDSEEFTKDIKTEKEIEDEISYPDEEPMQCVDPENEIKIEENEICYLQTETTVKQIEKGCETTINAQKAVSPPAICKPVRVARSRRIKKVHRINQTDKVIIYSLPRSKSGCIDPQLCECKKRKRAAMDNSIENITLQQFLGSCEKFLSPAFCDLVKNQVSLDELNKKINSTPTVPVTVKETRDASTDTSIDNSAGAANCVEVGAANCTKANVADCVCVDAGVSDCRVADAAD